VDQTKFQEAQQAYDSGDYRAAAKAFLASTGKGATGNGAAYHMAGNALMRLRRYADAVTVYGHALRDEIYDKRGPVYANLGTAYAALGELAQAETAYEAALSDSEYATPYRAHQGIASALMERGRIEEAAVAYRRAALDAANPDPGKALVNLGLCFMALGRPSDAVEAYKAALGFDQYQGRGKALANLGQAYTAMGEYGEAVKAFEKSTQLHNHTLSPAARASYETALAAVRPAYETVDGWETGELAPVAAVTAEPAGWASDELRALTNDVVAPTPAIAPDSLGPDAEAAAAALGFGDEAAVTEFFSMTEDEMKTRDREVRRAQRSHEVTSGAVAKRAAWVAVAVVAIAAALGAVIWLGFGWPTQTATASGLLTAYKSGDTVERYWVGVPGKDVAKEMAKIPPVKEYSVDSVSRGPSESTVKVTVTPTKGAALHYTVLMTREGVGWKVSGIENDWRSTGG